MSHLKLVGDKPPKPKKRKGERHETTVLTAEEQRQARQALRNLRDAFGTWACLADAMGVGTHVLANAMGGKYRITPALLLRASRASGLSIDDLLSVPVPADRCRACGQIKRGSPCAA